MCERRDYVVAYNSNSTDELHQVPACLKDECAMEEALCI